MSFDSLLIHRASITRLVQTLDEEEEPVFDDKGKAVVSLQEVFENVPCRLEESSVIKSQEGQNVEVLSSRVFMRPIAITETDHLEIDSRDFDIVSIIKQSDSESVHHFELMVKEVK